MVNINDIQLGNWIQVDIEGKYLTGKVERKSVQKIGAMVNKEMGWFFPKDVYPILLTEDWLNHLGFEEEDSTDGQLIYKHGPFRLVYPDKNDKQQIVLKCHGVHPRKLEETLYVHKLQSYYHEMTKVSIE